MYRNLNTNQATVLLMQDEYANWTWPGAEALVEYLEELEDSTNTKIEFDSVAIRCDFSEYESVLEAVEQYDFISPEDEDEDAIEAAALKYLEERTTVIQFDGGVIIQQF